MPGAGWGGGGGGASVSVPTYIQYLAGRVSGETAHDDDDFFDDASFSGWSTVTVSGSQTITEAGDLLSVSFASQSSSDMNCILKAEPTSGTPPLTIETAFTLMVPQENYNIAALVFADGATATDNAIEVEINMNDSTPDYNIRSGTLTALSTLEGADATFTFNRFFLRLIWKAANTFAAAVSPTGQSGSWTELGVTGDFTPTLTPTHMGIGWSRWGGGAEGAIASFDYFRVYESDLSL